MSVIPLVRQGVLGVTTLCSLIVLGLSAYFISQKQQYFFTTTGDYSDLALAVAVISLVTLPVMLLVDFSRRGAFTSMIVVELVWLFLLWILWVATAGSTDSQYNLFFPLGCGYFDNSVYEGMCRETQAIEALAFLNFIILLLYTGFLSAVAVNAAIRGQSIWLSSVRESFGPEAGKVRYPMTQSGPHPTETSHGTTV